MSQSRQDIIKEQLDLAVGDIIKGLPYMKQVFHNPTYDLNKSVENELDFLLGAVLGSILERNTLYLMNKQIKPTNEEFVWINNFVFSGAGEFKDLIRRFLEV